MADEEVQQGVLASVRKFTVCAAPLAVLLVQAPVRLPAQQPVVVQRHPAALADELPRRAQERVDGYVELARQEPERVRAGLRLARLPAADRLSNPYHVFFILGKK